MRILNLPKEKYDPDLKGFYDLVFFEPDLLEIIPGTARQAARITDHDGIMAFRWPDDRIPIPIETVLNLMPEWVALNRDHKGWMILKKRPRFASHLDWRKT